MVDTSTTYLVVVVAIESPGDFRLDGAAPGSLRWWRYRPAVEDGTPRRVYTYAKVTFELD